MFKIYHAILKELKLIQSDLLGFALIFLMPLILIITVTFIQDSIENNENRSFPILLINKDEGKVSQSIIKDLEEEGIFKMISEIEGKKIEESLGKKLIREGKEQILLIVPEEFSAYLQEKTDQRVTELLERVEGEKEGKTTNLTSENIEIEKEIEIFFDPALQSNIKNSIKNAFDKVISEMETKAIYETFEKEFDADFSFVKDADLVAFKERSVNLDQDKIPPNAVQHNLPAWALFAIFFIVIPLSINIVKEKNSGTAVRLKTLPVPSSFLIISKVLVYLLVCMIQFYLMLLLSVYIFPLLGLPALAVEGKLFQLSIIAFFAALAAIGFGVLIGTFAKTHEQAAPFGASSIIILAAIGGIWFPTFAMPKIMQVIAKASPMNWALEGFYNVLLRDAGFFSFAPYLLLLFLFFSLTLGIALFSKTKI